MPVVTSAAGVIATPLQELRVTLADCTEFRSWTGTANQTDALARIHLSGMSPPTYDEFTESEIDALRPYAIVESAQAEGSRFQHYATSGPTRHYRSSGTMLVFLEQEVGASLLNDPAELDRQFQNTLGKIISHPDHPTSDGLLDLAGSAGYLAINTLTVSDYQRATWYERVQSGDRISSIFEITWGHD